MNIKFLRHKASKGATALCNLFKEDGHSSKKLKINTRYTGRPTDVIINWGSSSRKTLSPDLRIINKPEGVALSANKISTFIKLTEAGLGGNLPKWTISKEEAVAMITNDLDTVYCRTLTQASEGRGIEVATTPDQVVSAPLYTSKVEVDREVRVHVCNGTVIDFAQKKRMGPERLEEEGIDSPDEDIRSHSRGWIFARGGVTIPEEMKGIAVAAVMALGLDFGAVDMAITPQGNFKIFEINSAPGLEGTTLESYYEALSGMI